MVELLRTKLFIPRPRKNLVYRPRLIKQLNAGLDRNLTLIAAPAGFGKTTLLSEWIPTSPRCVTWFSLDEADNDPAKFWTYFIVSLQQLDSQLGADALELLQSPQAPPITSILTNLINDITVFPDAFAIVFDDYHVIDSQPIHDALTFLIDHLPANIHLVINTRADPPLQLARLRARDKLTELRANDLRFSTEEAAAFLTQAMGLNLSAEEISALEARTEGWIAGLQIAALSLQGRSDISGFINAFSGSHRHILGYLAEEVINQQSETTLKFFLQTSILDRLCGPLCDAMTDETGGQATLENLEHSNLFIIPLDDEGRWYRYHHLFAEVLQSRLRQSQPDLIAELQLRASEWFERNGLKAEAVEYALRCHAWNRAMQLIEANRESALLRGELTTLLRWLGELPDEAIQGRPTLGLDHAWLLVLVDDFVTAEQRLIIADKALRDNPMPFSAEQAALLGQVASVREATALMLEYPADITIAAGIEALRLLPKNDAARRSFVLFILGCAQYISLGSVREAETLLREAVEISQASGNMFTEMLAWGHLSQMWAIQAGQLQSSEAACKELLHLATRPGGEQVPAGGLGRVMRGRILYEKNELELAHESLTQGVAEVEGYSLSRIEIVGYMLLARVEQALGNSDKSRELLRVAWSKIQKQKLKQITAPVAAYRVMLMLQFGKVAEAAKLVQDLESTLQDSLDPALEYDYMSFARVRLAQGQLEDAERLLAQLLPPAEEAGRATRVIEILVLQAVTASTQHNKVHAFLALERALTLAEPEGFVRTFIDEGEPMRLLLIDIQSKIKKQIGSAVENESLRLLTYTDKLLAAFHRTISSQQPGHETMPESLSERELEILQLIATGRTNQEIADILVVAVSTVKSHINSIYGKLGTNRRTQAIAIARDNGLLPK